MPDTKQRSISIHKAKSSDKLIIYWVNVVTATASSFHICHMARHSRKGNITNHTGQFKVNLSVKRFIMNMGDDRWLCHG